MSSPANPYSGKKTVVLGLGRSGIAAARLLLRCGADVTICDSGESELIKDRAELLKKEGVTVVCGEGAARDPVQYDLGIISPGIEETTPLVLNVKAKGTPLIGELELAFSLSEWPVVAITGSNGKTTTTELTTLMLQGAGLRCASCGNIGTPMSELIMTGEVWDILVVEVSSFQLETIKTFRPKVALWLNLSPNHLDRYPSINEYREAKLRIFENQKESDWAVIPFANDLPKIKAKKITFGLTSPKGDLTLQGREIMYLEKSILDLSTTQLHGPHNTANVMAAFGAGIALGADLGRMAKAISSYTPPPHRCEFIAERGGMRWINDSKATTLDAMEQAIRSVEGPLILIAGGKDKGFEFSPIAPLVREHVDVAILIGEMRHRIAHDWKEVPSVLVESLEEAVQLASKKGRPGTTVLFSPGTSSFDMFRDYVQRGEMYRRLVEQLPA
ncbi:MAG: UDP-N-acetylmuramoyl-L-alanine--D-glutamate ligase [Verrucomicrobiota bacterium]